MFIKNFLSWRHFEVLYGATVSDTYVQEEGVPQGAILSTTLFNIKLNDIVKVIMPGVECSLYVDDFVIMFKAKRMTCLSRKLKDSITAIEKWTRDNGFTIAVGDDKTVAMHFCRHRSCENPDLKLNGQEIKFVKEKKFLGLIWDTKLNFKAHIKYLKQKCQNSLNIIKILSHTDWGAGKKTLLKLYRALVRSKLDYGCIIYRNASDTDLKTLDVIHNQGIRLSLGAFKSSPVESLYVEANELPLRERRLELMMKYGLRIKCNTRNPAYKAIFDLRYKNKYNAPVHNARRNSVRPRRRARSLAVDLDELFQEAGISTPGSNLLSKVRSNKVFDYPPCYSKDIPVSFDLLDFEKSSTTDEVYQAAFGELVESRFSDYFHYYTDGSKKDEISSYGGSSGFGTFSRRICDHSSIFTAEAEGIIHALKHIRASPCLNGKFVIFSDSKSVLESIQTQNSKNIISFRQITNVKRSHKTIEFCWVPSHRGITGNEEADRAAERARGRQRDDQYEIPYTDLYPLVESFIRQKWQDRWEDADLNRSNKLFAIQPEVGYFDTQGLNRKEETVIHRLRIGHTRLTHSFLMEQRGRVKIPPICKFCNDPDTTMTVQHILIDCPDLYYKRLDFYFAPNMKYLFENIPPSTIVDFVKEIDIYKEI